MQTRPHVTTIRAPCSLRHDVSYTTIWQCKNERGWNAQQRATATLVGCRCAGSSDAAGRPDRLRSGPETPVGSSVRRGPSHASTDSQTSAQRRGRVDRHARRVEDPRVAARWLGKRCEVVHRIEPHHRPAPAGVHRFQEAWWGGQHVLTFTAELQSFQTLSASYERSCLATGSFDQCLTASGWLVWLH